MAEAIAETKFDLRGANIATFGEKAVDVFFVTDDTGHQLTPAQTDVLIQRLQIAAELEIHARAS